MPHLALASLPLILIAAAIAVVHGLEHALRALDRHAPRRYGPITSR